LIFLSNKKGILPVLSSLFSGISNQNSFIKSNTLIRLLFPDAGCYDKWADRMNGNIIGVIPDIVTLRDPWPGYAQKQEISWREFQSRCIINSIGYPFCETHVILYTV